MRARKTDSATKKSLRKRHRVPQHAAVMSETELAQLGGGQVAYIRPMSSKEALRMFPRLKGELPRGLKLFSLFAADGTPIALTDTRQAAITYAMEGELEISSIH